MKSAHSRIALAASALLVSAASPVMAQRPPSPEQRIAVLEQQLAVSQASAVRLEQRLNSIERQLQQLINQGEVNAHRIGTVESSVSKLRGDMDSRLTALESRPVMQQAPQTVSAAPKSGDDVPAPSVSRRSSKTTAAPEEPAKTAESSQDAASDPGEEAYSEGFHLWRDGKYDRAITALRAFVSGFPNHRRVSFARNLIGRALLDEGQPRPAAEALLANYRADPKGERAPDSLYYLGQALMRLDQPSQACKAYEELEDVYGSSVRPDLKALVAKGKADAHCS